MEKFPVSEPDIGACEEGYLADAAASGWVSSLGPYISRFEKEFAFSSGVDHACTVTNGTSALFVALRALGVGPDDEVIVPALTFAAVPSVVMSLGASPVLVDVDENTWCLDPISTKRALSQTTKAIVAVHSYGHPVDLDPILAMAGDHGISLVEDCAEAQGAKYKGKTVGSLGHAGAFSFYGNKIMTTGEGGMVTTRDGELADRVRLLRDHAMDANRRYYHAEVGYNLRLTNLQAALGCAQLSRIEELLSKRSQVLGWYREELSHLGDVDLNPCSPWAEPVNWMVCLLLKGKRADRRDGIIAELAERGIDTRPFFVALEELPPYSSARRVGRFGSALPIAARLSRTGLNLPSSPILSRSDVSYICGVLRSVL